MLFHVPFKVSFVITLIVVCGVDVDSKEQDAKIISFSPFFFSFILCVLGFIFDA